MALHTASLFYSESGNSVGSIQFDLLTSESHSLESQVTEHPIENGAVVSDHVRQLPRKGSLSGLVTNYPLKRDFYTLPQSFLEKLAALGNQNYLQSLAAQYGIKQAPTLTAADFVDLKRPENRAANTWELFKALMAAKLPVTITTGLEKYLDVIVTKVSTDRDSGTGDALTFRVEFQEIRVVTLTEVEITTTTKPVDLKTKANQQGTPKKSKGKTGGREKRGGYSYGSGRTKPMEITA